MMTRGMRAKFGVIGAVAACALSAVGLTIPRAADAQGVDVRLYVVDDTFDNPNAWEFSNDSGPGLRISACTIDLSTATYPGGLVFATAGTGTGDPDDDTDFTTLDAVTTGLVSPEADGLNDGDVTDRSTSFTIQFSDFDPGEDFVFGIDVDDTSGDAGIDGEELAGTSVACFVGGRRYSGRLRVTGEEESLAVLIPDTFPAPALSGPASALLLALLLGTGVLALRRTSSPRA